MTNIDDLFEAFQQMRANALAALEHDDDRWMVDQSPDDGLVVGSYAPDDVLEDGQISTSCVAYFAYPDDEQRRTHANAMPAAAHMAGLDPAVGLGLAGWLESIWFDVRDGRDGHSQGDVDRAVHIARLFLKRAES